MRKFTESFTVMVKNNNRKHIKREIKEKVK